MKLVSALFGGLIALALLTSVASAQDAEIAIPVKQCIDANAAKVERTVVSLSDATSFLVDNVCSDVIAAEQARESKIATQKMADRYQQLCAALKPHPTPSDPDEAGSDPCAMAKSMSDMNVGAGWTLLGAKQPMPIATSYAAKLLLSLRLDHMKSNP
jgi:hypothetical protein